MAPQNLVNFFDKMAPKLVDYSVKTLAQMKGNGSFFPCVKFKKQGKLFGKFLLAHTSDRVSKDC